MPKITRSSYQEGSFERVKRAKGPDVWVYRWRAADASGRRVQRKQVIGDVDRYRTKSDARRAVETLRAEINARQRRIGMMTVEEAWGHFQKHELRDPEVGRSQTTIENYLTLFKAHIIPRWGERALGRNRARGGGAVAAWPEGGFTVTVRKVIAGRTAITCARQQGQDQEQNVFPLRARTSSQAL